MNICGLNKLTLLDYPGKVACTVFTGGCNLRCPFCHNASLVTGNWDAGGNGKAELFVFLNKRRGVLDGVCVTGGEPLLHAQLPELLRRIKALGYLVKLDTNGCFPERLQSLVSQGVVDYVAMDIKSAPEKYAQAVGVPDFNFAPVQQSIDYLLADHVPYEFRTTVVGGLHDREVLREAAQCIRGAKAYFLQQFVDSGDLIGGGLSAFSNREMESFLAVVSPYVESAALRGV